MTKPIERYDKAIEHFNKAIKLNPQGNCDSGLAS